MQGRIQRPVIVLYPGKREGKPVCGSWSSIPLTRITALSILGDLMPTDTIVGLFSRELNRPIEKVITYQHRTPAQLKAEISEYIVTEHIEENSKGS